MKKNSAESWLDRLAAKYKNPIINQLSPETRILSALIFSVATAICDRIYLGFFYLFLAIAAVMVSELVMKDVFRLLKSLLWFLLMIWIFLPLTFGTGEIIKISYIAISMDGILISIKITLKSIAIMMVFSAFITQMPINLLGRGLQRLHISEKMIFLLLMSYRYIFVIQEEYRRLLRAARLRGFSARTNLHSYKTFAYLLGMIFIRASIRAQRVYQAMLCRGFKGKFYTLETYNVCSSNGMNLVFLTGVCLACVILMTVESI